MQQGTNAHCPLCQVRGIRFARQRSRDVLGRRAGAYRCLLIQSSSADQLPHGFMGSRGCGPCTTSSEANLMLICKNG